MGVILLKGKRDIVILFELFLLAIGSFPPQKDSGVCMRTQVLNWRSPTPTVDIG